MQTTPTRGGGKLRRGVNFTHREIYIYIARLLEKKTLEKMKVEAADKIDKRAKH